MIIKNRSILLADNLDGKSLDLRRIGLESIEIALETVRPHELIKKALKVQNKALFIQNDKFRLENYKHIIIIGGGKAGAEMAFAIEELLKSESIVNYKGLINIPLGLDVQNLNLSGKVKLNYASHPIPNKVGMMGVKDMVKLAEEATKDDLIFCLISGGGSALLPLPKEGLMLEELQTVNSLLLDSGASIHEINAVRKHLSNFKGGNLVKKIYNSSKATLISLIISDVVGNNLDSIASGPTVPDLTTFEDAKKVLLKYNLFNKIPLSAKFIIEKGIKTPKLENPKKGDECFNKVHNYLIGSVDSAAKEVSKFLKKQNFDVEFLPAELTGEAKIFGKMLSSLTLEKLSLFETKNPVSKIALIGTGELTVTIKGNGIGGRNQEMLLSLLDSMRKVKITHAFLIVSVNLDGIEGNSKAMGALIDNFLLNQMRDMNLEPEFYLKNNDSNSFFKKLGTELITGPTGCNVNDLVLILISR